MDIYIIAQFLCNSHIFFYTHTHPPTHTHTHKFVVVTESIQFKLMKLCL